MNAWIVIAGLVAWAILSQFIAHLINRGGDDDGLITIWVGVFTAPAWLPFFLSIWLSVRVWRLMGVRRKGDDYV